MPARRFLPLLAAATVGAMASAPATAQAGVSTAAWTTASAFCRGLAAGLSAPEAMRVAYRDNLSMWSDEMKDRAFTRLLAAEMLQQCPDLVEQHQSQQEPGSL